MYEARLEAIKGDIQYEINTIIFTTDEVNRLSLLIDEEKDEKKKREYKSQNNAFLESHLIHARVLRDFFCLSHCIHLHRDQALAEEYIGNSIEWHSNRYRMTYLEDPKTRKKLNALLAHLSYKRANLAKVNETDWDIYKTKFEILKAWKVFIENLPENRKNWFEPPPELPSELPTLMSNTSTSVSFTSLAVPPYDVTGV